MKRWLFAGIVAFAAMLGTPASAADRLAGVLTLAADDRAALAQAAKAPGRHVMMYFGDYQH